MKEEPLQKQAYATQHSSLCTHCVAAYLTILYQLALNGGFQSYEFSNQTMWDELPIQLLDPFTASYHALSFPKSFVLG